MHWFIGIFKFFGNFYTQKSASDSDFGLSPLNTIIIPCASFWIAGQIRSFLVLPAIFQQSVPDTSQN